jgi:hypothetical protein
MERQLSDYVIKAARKMQTDRIKALDVRESVVDKLNEYIDAWQETSVFTGGCRSWYKNNTVNGKVLCWGGSVSAYYPYSHSALTLFTDMSSSLFTF